MGFRFVFFALVFGSLWVLGCAQPAAPSIVSASPSAVVSVAPTPETSPSIAPSSPSVAPPTENPSPVVKVKPALSEFALQVHNVTSSVFNDTRDMRQVSSTLWVQDDFTPQYQYSVTVKRAVSRGWSAFDTLQTLAGVGGLTKEASVKAETSGTFYHYQATIKCFDAAYDVVLDLRDYLQDSRGTLRKDLGPAVMAELIAVCPS